MNELDAIFTRYYLQLIKSIAALGNCYVIVGRTLTFSFSWCPSWNRPLPWAE